MSGTKIYVGSLSYDAAEEDLEKHFSQFGEIKNTNVIMDRKTGRSKGFAFIEFDSQDSAKQALTCDGNGLMGRDMRVSIARDKK